MSSSEKRAIVLLSGGLDSVTTLHYARKHGYELIAVSFHYGQKHSFELSLASRQADLAGCVHHYNLQIDPALFRGSALTDSSVAVPEDREIDTTIPVTYVPGRNLLFLAHATSLAESHECDSIFIGANAVDYSGYPDCRPAFLESFEQTANLGTRVGVEGNRLKIKAPLVDLTKSQIVKLGIELGVDYSLTSSCYSPKENGRPCLKCDSCRIRIKGFEDAGLSDPLLKKFRT